MICLYIAIGIISLIILWVIIGITLWYHYIIIEETIIDRWITDCTKDDYDCCCAPVHADLHHACNDFKPRCKHDKS